MNVSKTPMGDILDDNKVVGSILARTGRRVLWHRPADAEKGHTESYVVHTVHDGELMDGIYFDVASYGNEAVHYACQEFERRFIL